MSDTPETKRALDYIYDRDGELWERNAPEKLVTLCRKLERERDEARKECEDLKTRLALMDDFKSQILQGYATAIGCAGHESPVRKAELLVKERDKLRAEVERLKAQAGEQNRCMNQLRELWKHLPNIENKYDERLAYHLDELIERLKADKARMDWLAALDCDSPVWGVLCDTTKLRETIDAAMKGEL